jgi:hypothetical protein
MTDQTCRRYSSSDRLTNFYYKYVKIEDEEIVMLVETMGDRPMFWTEIMIRCSNNPMFQLEQVSEEIPGILTIIGNSQYGCPVFDTNRFWTLLAEHTFVFGVVLFIVGFL